MLWKEDKSKLPMKPYAKVQVKISVRQKLLFFSFIILAGIGLIGYAVYKSNQKLLDSAKWVQHTEQVIHQSGNILSLAKDIKIASLGFVITNDTVVPGPHRLSEITFANISRLRQLTYDNPLQQTRIDSLNYYMHKYLDFSFETIELKSKQGLASAIAYNSTQQAKEYTAHILRMTDAIQQEEGRLLKQRKEVNERSMAAFNRFSMVAFTLMAVFTILLLIATGKYLLQDQDKEKRAAELIIANEELAFQNKEKEKRAAELIIANKELGFQNAEKEKRASELNIANKELGFQNKEKEKRAAELNVANQELAFQNKEKENRAAELVIANKELAFQNEEKEKRAAELIIANKELVFQNDEKEKRAAELNIANKELVFQNKEKEKRASELVIANAELVFQNKEKEKRAAELIIANKELAFQNKEKEKRAAELFIANEELIFQNEEKEKRAAELIIANEELAFQNEEKEKRAADLIIANKELLFQNEEKEKRAAELLIANNELKKAEDDIRKLNEELEQKVIKRTEELQSVNKELEAFSYSVSHDLRAPLRAVHGYARMLKEDYGDQLDPEANRVMNNITHNAKKMGQLIDDLLTFSHLGRKELVKMTIPMGDMVTNICKEIKNSNKERNIEFRIHELLPSQGDNSAIKRVWENLLSNATKYSKLIEQAVIEIDSQVNGNQVTYSIKDNGAGFDMRYANKLFGVFQRLHSDEIFEGTGVGLAIVHSIISKHGGKVWAEGKVNEGATFYFSLPKNAS